MTDEELKAAADDLMDDQPDHDLRSRIRDATSRGGFASVAANIAYDRYSAGSTAARAAIYIFAHYGFQAAKDFVADLQHHEG